MLLKFINRWIINTIFSCFTYILAATFNYRFEFSLIYFYVHISWKSLRSYETIIHLRQIIILILIALFLNLHGLSQNYIRISLISLLWSVHVNFWLFEFNIQNFLDSLYNQFIVIYNWYIACIFYFQSFFTLSFLNKGYFVKALQYSKVRTQKMDDKEGCKGRIEHSRVSTNNGCVHQLAISLHM
jgi:hypothetical protein